MSGECDECSECALDCLCPKYTPGKNDKFFYQGKFFETEEEFWAYVKDFTLRKTNAEDFDGLFNMLKKDVWANLMLRKSDITNSEVRNLLEELFMCFVKSLWGKNER
jgi:hypothetical protein